MPTSIDIHTIHYPIGYTSRLYRLVLERRVDACSAPMTGNACGIAEADLGEQ
jgi:hypothetical protein